MQKGKAGRREIVEMVEKLSRQDWTVDELKVRLGKLRHQGAELAAEWRDRARHEALDRLVEMHAKAIAFLGVASREQVTELSRELERLSRKLEKGKKAARKPTRRPTEA
jgi:hypothetical protein